MCTCEALREHLPLEHAMVARLSRHTTTVSALARYTMIEQYPALAAAYQQQPSSDLVTPQELAALLVATGRCLYRLGSCMNSAASTDILLPPDPTTWSWCGLAAVVHDDILEAEQGSQARILGLCKAGLERLQGELQLLQDSLHTLLTNISSSSNRSALLSTNWQVRTHAALAQVRAWLDQTVMPQLQKVLGHFEAHKAKQQQRGKGAANRKGKKPPQKAAAADSDGCSWECTQLEDFVTFFDGLSRTGEILTSRLTSSYLCSNPQCANMATCSAAFQLVRGKACVCGACVASLQQQQRPQLNAAR